MRLTLLLLLLAGCRSGLLDKNLPEDDADYRAFALASALNRVRIVRSADDSCAQLSIANPLDSPRMPVFTAPPRWAVEFGGLSRASARCLEAPPSQPWASQPLSGVITFGRLNRSGLPCVISVHGSIEPFARIEPLERPEGLPDRVRFDVDNLPIDDCE